MSDKFLEHGLLRIAESRLDALLNMKAIYIDCGTGDASKIKLARGLHEKFNDLGVEHAYKEIQGNAYSPSVIMGSVGDALKLFSDAMAFEVVTGVEPKGKLVTMWGGIKSD